MSSFLLTLEAKKDLEEIYDFIAQDNPTIALSFINYSLCLNVSLMISTS